MPKVDQRFIMLRRPFISSMRLFSESFSIGANSDYIELMYARWKSNPESVHVSWRAYFEGIDSNIRSPFMAAPGLGVDVSIPESIPSDFLEDMTKALLLHRMYQSCGMMLSDLDPLNLNTYVADHTVEMRLPSYMKLDSYKFSKDDMEKFISIGSDLMKGFRDINGPHRGIWKLKDFIDTMHKTYCGKIGFEFLHIPFRDETNWIRERIERVPQFEYTPIQQRELYEVIARGHMLEEFFHRKFATHKRFGMDGLEAVVLAVESVIRQAADNGVKEIIIGMPHRGRLSVMVQNLQNDLEDMFRLFFGVGHRLVEEGDVKYHLGCEATREINGKQIQITLLANPSHLEAVDPVTVGFTRAIQQKLNSRNDAMAILLHGDAALAGQGIVYETLQMEDLFGYSTGGVVHIVMNNNIGFTTTPKDARTSLFPTDIGKTVGAPIFHVNSDYPEEVDFVSKLATDWRQQFRKSAFIDIIGYRKYGHNELDEPLFTNPKMYQLIHKKAPAYELFGKRLVDSGAMTAEDLVKVRSDVMKSYEKSFSVAKRQVDTEAASMTRKYFEWRKSRTFYPEPSNTGVPIQTLNELAEKINFIPKEIQAHPQIVKNYRNRLKNIQNEGKLDWASGEALAWASILQEKGKGVRISGQDVERGTFSHRHAVIHDQKRDREKYIPLSAISNQFTAVNSHLSEYGVLGFEYGFSLANPDTLVIWEAQFGDFVNGAQIIIDQFLVSGEAKWGQQSNIVLLLPHGFDGQGSEHSYGRLGRFLQLSSEDSQNFRLDEISDGTQPQLCNIQVVIPTTPANYFHMLRRQVMREFGKPLIVMSPKKLLRHRGAISNLEEFTTGTVKRFIGETDKDLVYSENVRKVIICCGQVYFDLVEDRTRKGIKDVAIVRLEQITPFPFDRVLETANLYPNAEFSWVQEEPMNLGAWEFVRERTNAVLLKLGRPEINIVSRPRAATTATGYLSVHNEELNNILTKAFE